MTKMLISCTYYYPNISGVSVYAQLLAEEMAKKGFEVTVLTSAFQKYLKPEEINNGIKIKRCPVRFRIGKGVIMPGFWWKSYKEVRSADIVNCHLPQLESVCLGVWSKILKKRFIITHHCEFGIDGPWSNKLIGLMTYPFHFISYLLADTIISYTQDYASHSHFLKHFKKKLVFILPPIINGIEDENKKKKLAATIGIDKETKIIGYVGRIGWEKGLDHLLNAIEEIKTGLGKPIKIVLAGPYKDVVGDSSFEKLKPLIEKNKNSVLLIGPLPHEDLVNFYSLCDCLVLPSTNNLETFGLVQAEAMIAGCPVVASDLPGVRVPVRLTSMGKIAKIGDEKDLAAKICQVINQTYDPELTQRAKKIFSFSNFINDYYALLSGEK